MNAIAPAAQDGYGRMSLRAGAPLFHEGALGTAAYLVESGELEIFLRRDETDVVLARRGAGELIGEVAVLDGGPRTASARALSDCRLLVIEAAQLEGRSGRWDSVLRMCLQLVLARYRDAVARVRSISPQPVNLPPPPVFTAAVEELQLERELRRALEQNEFELFFQPIVTLDGRDLAGFEALIRWRHPERGLVMPGAFIPVVEESGMIVDLTAWCVREVGRVLPAIVSGRPDDEHRLFLTVNVSAPDLLSHGFAQSVSSMLHRIAADPSSLKVEVTESMLMTDLERASATLLTLQKLGVGIAIDDFGTGCTSLSVLSSLPITTLKIDRSFIVAMRTDPVQHKVVRAIIRLAEDLGFSTVAEGVEHADEADTLAKMGCTFGQGYLWGRPMPLDTTLSLIRNWHGHVSSLQQGDAP